jgi:hypothetical protein
MGQDPMLDPSMAYITSVVTPVEYVLRTKREREKVQFLGGATHVASAIWMM